ncbi:MAG: DUF5808 domain-containing protein [Prolixibacteraceae bacterium]
MEDFNDPTGNFNNYKWGFFYYNKSDKRVFVPKRSGMGYTLNFGKPFVTLGFILFLLLIIAQAFFRYN